MKLNIGCGKRTFPDMVNVDLRGGDLLGHMQHLPFRDEAFDYILASHVLEHEPNLVSTIEELHRVLRPKGLLQVFVPYGTRWLCEPFHYRAFDLLSFEGFTQDHPFSLEYGALFRKREAKVVEYMMPLSYHIEKYAPAWLFRGMVRLGIFEDPERPGRMFGWRLPLTPRAELSFILEKLT